MGNTGSMDCQRVMKAVEALEDAYRAVFAAAEVGMTADDIDAILSDRLTAHGSRLLPEQIRSTPFVVAADGAPPKLRINRAPLAAGKLWAMDTSIRVNGWWADLGRYGWFGPAPAGLRADYSRVVQRQAQVAAAIRPGMSMKAIFDAAGPGLPFEVHRIGAEPGMPPVVGDMLGSLVKGMADADADGLVFQPGQAICVELWAGLMGGIEDMYRVTDTRVERISTLPQDLYVLGLS